VSFKAIIFDLGGVLVRRDLQRILQPIARQTHKPIQQLTHAVEASMLVERFELGQLQPRRFHAQLSAELGLAWSYDEFVSVWNSILSENTDATWLLERLRTRYRLLVLSNTNILHDEYIRRTWPVFHYIHHWITSYQTGYRKPELQIYQLALREADIPPESTVYVDDIKECVMAARQLGLTAVHFTQGLRLEEELRSVGLHV